MPDFPEIPPDVFSEAVESFWATRDKQISQQAARGGADQGLRSAVTGGAQMDGFARAIAELLIATGVPETSIFASRNVALPGYFRPTKEWDLLVVMGGRLIAAIELKSQVGPSFGNNFNNRTEEAMGTALDTWTAFREMAYNSSVPPWLGYVFLLEDTHSSRTPVRVHAPHFEVFESFRGASYTERYLLFCRRLMLERQYTATCFLTSARLRATERPNYQEPAKDLSAREFMRSLLSHVAGYV